MGLKQINSDSTFLLPFGPLPLLPSRQTNDGAPATREGKGTPDTNLVHLGRGGGGTHSILCTYHHSHTRADGEHTGAAGALAWYRRGRADHAATVSARLPNRSG